MLFETGPGNPWLVRPWARRAPHPRGGSFAIEIYKRLPNDTDFSILKRHEIPGLNFAIVGDSYAYHTARDTPSASRRSPSGTTGENVVASWTALQQRRHHATDARATPPTSTSAAPSRSPTDRRRRLDRHALAVVLGVVGWLRVTRFVVRERGAGQLAPRTPVDAAGAVAAVAGGMVGATWVLRGAARSITRGTRGRTACS